MRKFRWGLVTICLLLVASVLFNLAGCSKQAQAENLMSGVYTHLVETISGEQLKQRSVTVSDFSFRLFKECNVKGESTVISPVSVLYALGMAFNGADGETLQQMESLMGMSIQELNQYLYTYQKVLSQEYSFSEAVHNISLSNSIWYDNEGRFTPNKDFLQANADYYNAGVFNVPFNEEGAQIINDWVNEKTNGMIPKAVNDQLPKEAVMFLINTLLFESQWQDEYLDESVKEEIFTKEDGTEQTADFMYSNEEKYFENEMVTGFEKRFLMSNYKFVALLPKEGYSVEECLENLDVVSFQQLYEGYQYAEVDASIPKFKTKFNIDMSDVLGKTWLSDAFNGSKANFSKMGTSEGGTLYISKVLHDTTFEIDEKGVKAGAATTVVVTDVGGGEPDEKKVVHLDRPFIYMILDTSVNLPLFIGTMMDVEK